MQNTEQNWQKIDSEDLKVWENMKKTRFINASSSSCFFSLSAIYGIPFLYKLMKFQNPLKVNVVETSVLNMKKMTRKLFVINAFLISFSLSMGYFSLKYAIYCSKLRIKYKDLLNDYAD